MRWLFPSRIRAAFDRRRFRRGHAGGRYGREQRRTPRRCRRQQERPVCAAAEGKQREPLNLPTVIGACPAEWLKRSGTLTWESSNLTNLFCP